MSKYGKIKYDDDIVIVTNSSGEVIYKGLEDYEPMKNEPWVWDAVGMCYHFHGLTKRCILS